jgi:DNA modification methylase
VENAGMIHVVQGDCRLVLPTLPSASVQCVVTSPPYFGLRDYGTAQWSGGRTECDHARQSTVSRASSGLEGATTTQGGAAAYRTACGRCGAIRVDRQIGLEASPDEYIAELVTVFREVRRVLRDDGVLFLNLGDSYCASPPGNKTIGVSAKSGLHGVNGASGKYRETLAAGHQTKRDTSKLAGLKPKDLIGIPWMAAFALRADGWWLRSDIIWAKPNPMPESVTDRPTSAHEHVFLLTKSARYYWDGDAVGESAALSSIARLDQDIEHQEGSWRANGGTKTNGPMRAVGGDMRNCRNVWTIATQPFKSAHFATFPPALAERCIKAGSRPGDTILDPFSGAGTTAMVADRLGRAAIGIELNPAYSAMAHRRVVDDCPLFAEVAAQ